MLKLTFAVLLMTSTPLAARVFHLEPSADSQGAIQLALIEAEPGDTVHLSAGTYVLEDGLSLDIDDVTIKGDGPESSILSFKGQTGAGEGLLVTSDGVLLTGFAIEDTRGDAIKAKGVDRLTFDNLRAEWTNGPDAKNGAYGFYPVESTNILIQDSEVIACSDAGIYVGQSDNIIVRNNRVHQNVAGIEIENSTRADVYGNLAYHNTGGILVFDLPDLPMVGGHSTRIYDNVIVNNDTPNFASPGNIVASVPQGLGIMVMANRNVHVFDNFMDGNSSAHIMIVGYTQDFTDERYNPLARDVVVRGNVMGRGGHDPQFEGGQALAAALGGAIPDVMWDGAAAFMRAGVKVQETARMSFDAPAVSLNLPMAGADVAGAQPSMVSATAEIAEPEAVVLPENQPGIVLPKQSATKR